MSKRKTYTDEFKKLQRTIKRFKKTGVIQEGRDIDMSIRQLNIIHLLKDLLNARGIEVHLLKQPYDNIQSFDGGLRQKLCDDYDYSDIIEQLESSCKGNTIYMVNDQFEVHYMIFRVPCYLIDSHFAEFVIIGPYMLDTHDKMILDIVERNQLPLFLISELEEYYCGIPVITLNHALESDIIVLAQYIFGGRDKFVIDRTGMNFNWSMNQIEYKIEPENTLSMSVIEERYRHEDEMLNAIEQGNLEKAMICYKALAKYRIQPRTTDSLRDKKNLMIVLNSLYRKAVQRAEVHPAHIDSVSASFARKIEASANLNDLSKLFLEIIRKYCLLVQNHSLRGYSEIIQKVINYIDFNIHEPSLSLKFFSEKYFVNSSYLSSQFKKETGNTLTDHINQKRIQNSLILLATTDLPIKVIAEKVGVYDESYFSRLFKRIQGKTARQYRNMVKSKI